MVRVYIDSNIPMYVAGRDHPLREPARRFLERVRAAEVEACTSTEVLQEILYRYIALKRPDLARQVYELFSFDPWSNASRWPTRIVQSNWSAEAVVLEFAMPSMPASCSTTTSATSPASTPLSTRSRKCAACAWADWSARDRCSICLVCNPPNACSVSTAARGYLAGP